MARIGTKAARERLQDRIDRIYLDVQTTREAARVAQREGKQEDADRLYREAAETNRYLTQVCRQRHL